jgi:hypothetical protein
LPRYKLSRDRQIAVLRHRRGGERPGVLQHQEILRGDVEIGIVDASPPPTSTAAFIGWARIISSVSIAIRLRNIRLVGLRNTSASDTSETSRTGRPSPAAALDRPDQPGRVPTAIVEAGKGVALPIIGRVNSSVAEGAPQVKRESGSP